MSENQWLPTAGSDAALSRVTPAIISAAALRSRTSRRRSVRASPCSRATMSTARNHSVSGVRALAKGVPWQGKILRPQERQEKARLRLSRRNPRRLPQAAQGASP